MSKENKPKSYKSYNLLFIVIGIIIFGYLSWAIWYWQCHPEQAGQFGDMFGAVTSILTFLTVVLLIKSINLQSEELRNSVTALNHSAKELELTRLEFEKQNETSKASLKSNKLLQQTTRKQRIETTLFNLFGLLEIPSRQQLTASIDSIHYAVFQVPMNEQTDYDKILNRKTGKTYYDIVSAIELLTAKYNKNIDDIIPESFYRIVISILSYIKQANQSAEAKQSLMNIFRSLLSQEALTLVIYHLKLHRDFNGKFVNQELYEFAFDNGLFSD